MSLSGLEPMVGPSIALGRCGRLGGDGEAGACVGKGGRVFPEAGVAAEIADAEGEPEGPFGRGDLGDAFQTPCRFDERHDRDIGQSFGGLGDVVDRFDHRQHHAADGRAGQCLQVVGPPGGAEAVDPHPVGVSGAEPAHDVVAGGGLVLRRDRILDVENDDVGAGVCGGLEPVVLRAVDQQPTPGEYRVDARADVGRIGRVGGDLFGHEVLCRPVVVVYCWPKR